MNEPSSSSTAPTPPTPPATLRAIIEHTRAQIELDKAREPIDALRELIEVADPPRDFFGVLTKHPNKEHTNIIAEIKRSSPSAGLIRPEYAQDGFDPELIAIQYSKAGASAISCLTDKKFFGGDLTFIRRIKSRVALPVLRKDFVVDPYQIEQSRAYGADAILLIAECLGDEQIIDMLAGAHRLGLAVLLEVHSRANLLRVLPIMKDSPNKRILLGINNRDLTRMVTDLAHTTDLVDLVENKSILVSESGIKSQSDLGQLRYRGVYIALIGEHLMRQNNPGEALKALLR